MNSQFPKEEVERDLANTRLDVNRLRAIVENLESFIYKTDENRLGFKTDLFKYRSLLTQAEQLESKIAIALEQYIEQ